MRLVEVGARQGRAPIYRHHEGRGPIPLEGQWGHSWATERIAGLRDMGLRQ